MNDTKLVKQIGELIDTKLKAELKPIKEQLDTVEMKVGSVDKRVKKEVGLLNKRMDGLTGQAGGLTDRMDSLSDNVKQMKRRLEKKIEESQKDTIEILSELIHSGYDMHKERITNIEHHLNLTPPQK